MNRIAIPVLQPYAPPRPHFHVAALGQQAPVPVPGTPTSIVPSWGKIAFGSALIVAGAVGGYHVDPRNRLYKSTPEILASVGSFMGGVWILLEGIGLDL